MEILKVENLSFKYPQSENKALDNINFSVEEGEFILLCGKSGCGKTTLLRLLKKEIAPYGELSGNILYKNVNQKNLENRQSVSEIGFVMQNPEQQIVTDKVWHELSFGLESLAVENAEIRRRVAEASSYFGIEHLFRKETSTLSGGEKQLLNLASIMVMNPKVLILDEPTSQLDPIAANEFISTVNRLNKDWGITVILSEHRTEELFSLADRVAVMDKGQIIADSDPGKVAYMMKGNDISMGFPTPVRVFQALSNNTSEVCPLTVKAGREYLRRIVNGKKIPLGNDNCISSKDTAFELKDVCFKYSSQANDILKMTSLRVFKGEVYTLLGGNGAGKSTLLKVISGIEKPYSGKITILGKNIKKYRFNSLYKNTIAVLPQNPQEAFIRSTLSDDFKEMQEVMQLNDKQFSETLKKLTSYFEIEHLLTSHPYDLSGGELQKAALIKILLLKPQILLLDEPSKGMDAYSKFNLVKTVKNLKKSGITILIVTHDIEFAAECSDRCGLFFDGDVISQGTARKFLSSNTCYTTSACKMARDILPDAVTCNQIIKLCKMNGDD